MTDYALQANIYTDSSSLNISDVDYDRAFMATIKPDTSSMKIAKVEYDRALIANIYTDKSKVAALMFKYTAYLANIYTDKSKVKVDAKRDLAISSNIKVQPAKTNIFLGADRSFIANLSKDSSSIKIVPKVDRALQATIETDSSRFNITKIERDILTEAPTGQTYVIIKGVDVSLNGYSLARNSVHAINILIYGDRLSEKGTDIEFIVKRNISDPDDSAVIYNSTNGGSIALGVPSSRIKFIQVKDIPETELKEYKAQIQLRESDFYLITNQRPTKLYYEVRVIDSLDGRYPPVEAGYFNLSTTLIENRF